MQPFCEDLEETVIATRHDTETEDESTVCSSFEDIPERPRPRAEKPTTSSHADERHDTRARRLLSVAMDSCEDPTSRQATTERAATGHATTILVPANEPLLSGSHLTTLVRPRYVMDDGGFWMTFDVPEGHRLFGTYIPTRKEDIPASACVDFVPGVGTPARVSQQSEETRDEWKASGDAQTTHTDSVTSDRDIRIKELELELIKVKANVRVKELELELTKVKADLRSSKGVDAATVERTRASTTGASTMTERPSASATDDAATVERNIASITRDSTMVEQPRASITNDATVVERARALTTTDAAMVERPRALTAVQTTLECPAEAHNIREKTPNADTQSSEDTETEFVLHRIHRVMTDTEVSQTEYDTCVDTDVALRQPRLARAVTPRRRRSKESACSSASKSTVSSPRSRDMMSMFRECMKDTLATIRE